MLHLCSAITEGMSLICPTTRTPKSPRMSLQVIFSQDRKNSMTIVASPPPKLRSDLRERGEGRRRERQKTQKIDTWLKDQALHSPLDKQQNNEVPPHQLCIKPRVLARNKTDIQGHTSQVDSLVPSLPLGFS